MDRVTRQIMKQGLDLDDRPQPIVSGSKSGGGGVRITKAIVASDLPQHAGRYPFRIEGYSPNGVKLDDLAILMEARFQGDPKFNLRHSKDEAIQRLRARMEKRVGSLKEAEERAQSHATNLAEQKEKYEATRDEIEREAMGDLYTKKALVQADIDQAEQLASSLRGQIASLNEELGYVQNDVKDRLKAMEAGQDRVLGDMRTNSMDEPLVTGDQASALAVNLLEHWQSSLQEYGEAPMASEYDDLAGMLAKLLTKTVSRVNDRWRDAGREEPAGGSEVPKDRHVRSSGDGSLF